MNPNQFSPPFQQHHFPHHRHFPFIFPIIPPFYPFYPFYPFPPFYQPYWRGR